MFEEINLVYTIDYGLIAKLPMLFWSILPTNIGANECFAIKRPNSEQGQSKGLS